MSSLRNKRILITGGAGFIGSNIAMALAKENDVVVFDNLSTGYMHNLKSVRKDITFIKGSITDLAILRKSMKGVDYVFHEAALCSVPRSIENPILTNETNIKGTLNVLMAARGAGVKRVVYAASSSAYGNAAKLPKQEDMNTESLSPYALSKLAGEHYLKIFSSLYGLDTVSLRYFNIFGPYQDPSSQYSAVIPLFAKAILKDKRPKILGDGKQSRDFTYIENVVQANILACKAKKLGGEVINVACGKRITLLDLVRHVNSILGKNIKPSFGPERAGDVKHSLADISKAKRLLGYEPTVGVREGLKRTIDFYRVKR